MELKYIILTIIKILISVPAIVLVAPVFVEGAALMGGHLDNKSNSTAFLNLTSSYFDFDLGNNQELSTNDSAEKNSRPNPKNTSQPLEGDGDTNREASEEIPDPSALVVPGYNLPENIFNKGKPFYLEKDPLTGAVDFENRSPNLKTYDEYDYASEEDLGGSSDMQYAKANIDRKDGGLSSHKNSDVNQLTPNLYDFLNLPLKYNSDKYIYPLISSSYANTKVQGNVNKHYNHKDYSVVTTYRPVKTPTYFPTKSAYFNKEVRTTEKMVVTTTTPTPTKTTAQVYLTTAAKEVNLMDSAMNHPSFTQPPQKTKVEEIYLTTTTTEKAITSSSSSSTTERIMSLFEQFIAGFDEPITTTEKPPSSTTSGNLNGHASPQQNILTGTNMAMGHPSAYDYEYEEDVTDNIAVETKPTKIHVVMMQNGSAPTENQKQPNSNSTRPDLEYPEPEDEDYPEFTTAKFTTTPKVTSLPLGENHVSYSNPIIVATQNLREQLNNEKVLPKPFGFDKPLLHPVSGTSNIHIAPDQDTVSFVVGNHQNVDGQYIGSALKESPYDTNPFRPLYTQPEQNANNNQNVVSYTIQTSQEVYKPAPPQPPPQNYDNVKIQPMRNSEASLAIGVPLNLVKGKPGQVVDESSEINNEKIEFPKGNGPKIVFPDEKSTYVPPPPSPSKNFLHPPNKPFMTQPNREVLKLNSQPMFHQLPSDLTPPNEPNMHSTVNRDRPPWDPRPGHFHSGRPEYARPPRPPSQSDAFKRIDSLPNILPQFRPNVKHVHKGYMRQPLLDRPSNRPIGFFEKLHPPPPPKLLQGLRKEQELNYRQNAPDVTDGYKKTDQYMFYQTPPKMVLAATRRNGDDDVVEVETLQMLQAKQDKKEKTKIEMTSSFQANLNGKDSIEKPIYVVYPVNTPPLKLDAIDTNKKESVVIGTRAELPLPPSKIKPDEIGDFEIPQDAILKSDYKLPPSDFDFQQNDRHDSPILKPHHRPPNLPIKSEFPYPLERPTSLLNSAPVEMETTINDLDNQKFSSNQWNSLDLDDTESRIVTGSKINTQSNQISVKLKTYSEKPIAVAYTPTESQKTGYDDRYSLPNYASPVIPEIRLENVPSNSAFVLKSTGLKLQEKIENANGETTHVPQLDFQAPFQASLNVDNVSHGWSVIKEKAKEDDGKDETTTSVVPSTSEFDIENFKPQLIGGFKPIYNFPDDEGQKEMEVKERQE